MRILILGGNGLLGHRAARLLPERHEVVATVRRPDPVAERIAPGARFVAGVFAEDPESVSAAIEGFRPDAVVNCVGIVKQRPAGHEAIPSITVNALFPHQVAEICSQAGVRLVHISTDCVFSGKRGLYTEEDFPDADDLYGRTKFLGEIEDVAGAVTVRTSLIGWEIANRFGVLEWFARQRGGACEGYTRAMFSGLASSDLVDVVERFCTDWADMDGLWQVSNDVISKYDLIAKVNGATGWGVDITPSDELVIDRSLDSTRFRRHTGWEPRSWDEIAERLAAERPAYEELDAALT